MFWFRNKRNNFPVHSYMEACIKLNFCCNELQFKLNWYNCANTNDVVRMNFSVIKSVRIKSFSCTPDKDI